MKCVPFVLTVTFGLAATVLLLPAVSPAQDPVNIDYLGGLYDFWDDMVDCDLDGTLLAVATDETGVQFVRVTNFEPPEIIGRTERGVEARNVTLAGDLAFVSKPGRPAYIYDTSNPAFPVVLATFDAANYFSKAMVEDDLLVWITGPNLDFYAFDISNPANPVAYGEVPFGRQIREVMLHDGILYIGTTSPEQVVMLDISDPTNPVQVATLPIDNTDLLAMAAKDDFVFMAYERPGGSLYLESYNVLLPNDPIFRGQCSLDVEPEHMERWYNYLFVMGPRSDGSGHSINTISVTFPPMPNNIGFSPAITSSNNIFAAGNNRVMFGSPSQGLTVMDMDEPDEPVVYAELDVAQRCEDLALDGDMLWTGWSGSGFRGADLGGAGGPVELVHLAGSNSYCNRLAVEGDHLVVNFFTDTNIFDISTPANPQWQSSLDPFQGTDPFGYWTMRVSGDRLYVVDYDETDTIIMDLSEPEDPTRIGDLRDLWYMHPTYEMRGDTLFVISKWAFAAIDLSDPGVADIIGETNLNEMRWTSRAHRLGRGYALSPTQEGDLAVIRFVDRDSPALIAEIDPDPEAQIKRFHVQGDYLFAAVRNADNQDELRVYDVSDPLDWELTGRHSMFYEPDFIAGNAEGRVAVSNGLTVDVFDVSAAMEPDLFDLDLIVPEPFLARRGHRLVFHTRVANNSGGLAYLDVWTQVRRPNGDLTAPIWNQADLCMPAQSVRDTLTNSHWVPWITPLASYSFRVNIGEYPDQVFASDEFEVELVPWTGVDEGSEMTESELPTQFTLSQAHPNPFNPTSTLTLTLPQAGEVTVTVFDLTGRQVATFADGAYPAGRHRLTVDGSRWASGVYFVRAVVPGELDVTRKLVLMK